jgi:hypothetical protein
MSQPTKKRARRAPALKGDLHLIQVRVTQETYTELMRLALEEGDIQVGVYARRVLFEHVKRRREEEGDKRGP